MSGTFLRSHFQYSTVALCELVDYHRTSCGLDAAIRTLETNTFLSLHAWSIYVPQS